MFRILTSTSFQFLPKWLAPNVLTFGGMLLVMLGFVVVSYFDYYILASSDSFPQYPSIPNIVWLFLAVCTFCAHVMGRINYFTGKSVFYCEVFMQTERTGSRRDERELLDPPGNCSITVLTVG